MSRRTGLIVLGGAGLLAAIAIRLALLPRPGLAGDDDGFLSWVRWIANAGLGRAYDAPVSFPAVMPWLWWLSGRVAPAILAPNPGDPAALAVLKLPASLADLAIAGLVAWQLRSRPGWAVAAGLAILLVPATWYVSAWWGQFESLYVLPMVVAFLLVTRGRFGWAAVAIGIGLMTKPQALPLAVPFAAFYLRRFGVGRSAVAVAIAAATAAALWLPFLAAGGPANYLRTLAASQDLYAYLSLRAWNPWWILQSALRGGAFVSDQVAVLGPVTFRWLGIAIAGLLEAAVFLLVWRRPTATALAWGLAAASLAAFVGLTTMHERYAFAALAFLPLAWPDRLAVGAWLLLAVAISANLVAAVAPSNVPGSVLPVEGLVGIVGSLAMTAGLCLAIVGLRRAEPAGEPAAR